MSPIYPTPPLGDFGSSISTADDDPRNPKDWGVQSCCTEGFRPPELISYADYETREAIDQTDQLLEHTNVWQYGLILWCLVTKDQPSGRQVPWLGDGRSDTTFSLQGTPAATPYRKDLIKLIEDCMRYDCARRPNFESILARVNKLRESCQPSVLFDDESLWRLKYERSDKYVIGMTWPPPEVGEEEPEGGGDEVEEGAPVDDDEVEKAYDDGVEEDD